MAKQVDAGTSMTPSTPVSPEERFSADHEWMHQPAFLARFLGGVAMPLARLAQQARTATANAGGIHYAEAAISLSTVLLGKQRVSCWAPKRSVWLERQVCARKAACFPRRVAVAGGAYPETGAAVGGRVEACSFCGGRGGANSVVRTGSG